MKENLQTDTPGTNLRQNHKNRPGTIKAIIKNFDFDA